MNYWLVKQEPESYAWADLVKERRTVWSGVRNYQARNNLKAMAKGDPVFFYHSGDEKQIVGLARVVKAAYPDPTATEGDWVYVELAPEQPLAAAVTLATIKADKILNAMALARNSRLSVSPVTERQFQRVLELSQTKMP
jgi:predicted RNA-binding protein with PUA-like domain